MEDDDRRIEVVSEYFRRLSPSGVVEASPARYKQDKQDKPPRVPTRSALCSDWSAES